MGRRGASSFSLFLLFVSAPSPSKESDAFEQIFNYGRPVIPHARAGRAIRSAAFIEFVEEYAAAAADTAFVLFILSVQKGGRPKKEGPFGF